MRKLEDWIKEGDAVTCPKCDTVMLVAKHDIAQGEIIGDNAFFRINYTGVKGDKLECRKCRIPFGQSFKGKNKLHTKRGWV